MTTRTRSLFVVKNKKTLPRKTELNSVFFYFYPMLNWQDFEKVDIRTGTILQAEDFPEAKKPAYKLTIDFGELGIRKSSAQLTKLYSKEDLKGMQIVAVVNFPPKQIGPFISECLVLGAVGTNGEVTLLRTERNTSDGSRIA